VVECAGIVVQAQQQRADVGARPILVPSESGDDAVGRPLVLDLEHRPFAGLVRGIEALGDHPVEPGTLEPGEPVGGHRSIRRRRRQVDRRLHGAEHRFQSCTPLALWGGAQVLVTEGEQVPRDEARRRLRREHPDT
jgi:hypothetical protein